MHIPGQVSVWVENLGRAPSISGPLLSAGETERSMTHSCHQISRALFGNSRYLAVDPHASETLDSENMFWAQHGWLVMSVTDTGMGLVARVSLICLNGPLWSRIQVTHFIMGDTTSEKERKLLKAGLRLEWGEPGVQGTHFQEAALSGLCKGQTPHLHEPESNCFLKLHALGVSFVLP